MQRGREFNRQVHFRSSFWKQRITHTRGNNLLCCCSFERQAFQFTRENTSNPSCAQKLVSHRGAEMRRGLFCCLVFGAGVTTRIPRSSLPKSGVPQSRPLNKKLGGRAGRVPAGRTSTPKPGKKKEKRERERERQNWTMAILAQGGPWEGGGALLCLWPSSLTQVLLLLQIT